MVAPHVDMTELAMSVATPAARIGPAVGDRSEPLVNLDRLDSASVVAAPASGVRLPPTRDRKDPATGLS